MELLLNKFELINSLWIMNLFGILILIIKKSISSLRVDLLQILQVFQEFSEFSLIRVVIFLLFYTINCGMRELSGIQTDYGGIVEKWKQI